MISKKQKVRILWKDARLYDHRMVDIKLSDMETEGYVQREQEDYLVIKNISTKNIDNGKNHPNAKEKPNFFFIPKSFIISIKNI